MSEIEIAKVKYNYYVEGKKMTIFDENGRMATFFDADNQVGDPRYYEDWEDFLYEEIDNLIFLE